MGSTFNERLQRGIIALIATLSFGALAYFTSSTALTASIEQWTSAGTYTTAIANRNVVSDNRYLYAVGGKTSNGVAQDAVRSAKINTNGTLGPWTATSSLPKGLYLHATAISDDHIYVVGGWDGSTTHFEIWRSALTDNGELGAWQQMRDYPIAAADPRGITLHEAVIVGERLYVMGGRDGFDPVSHVYYAQIQSGGLGGWKSAADLPEKLYRIAATTHRGYIYVTGGYDEILGYAAVYYGKVNPDGNIHGMETGNRSARTTILPRNIDPR